MGVLDVKQVAEGCTVVIREVGLTDIVLEVGRLGRR
jgi:hypothetical protein